MNRYGSPAVIPVYSPASAGEVQDLVQSLPKVLPHGGQSKPALSRLYGEQEVARLDMTKIAGITEYDPGEYTFTAYAGTRLDDIAASLAEHGQYLPFDPPLLARGATLGGTIAAGLSGSGRIRYGGIRDFILGIHFVDGQGRLVRSGGKVVKNAAGFDLSKLMVGSLGRLGILISASFKVFPAPVATATLCSTMPSLTAALAAMAKLTGGPNDLEALDLIPQSSGSVMLHTRIGGPAGVLVARLDRLRSIVGSGEALMDDKTLWTEARELTWAEEGAHLVKVATTPQGLALLDPLLDAAGAQRRYAVGGNLAWIAWPDSVESCHHLLADQRLSGLLLCGESTRALIGLPLHANFRDRIRLALDPLQRFVEFE